MEAPEPCIACSDSLVLGATWNYILAKMPELAIKADSYDIDGFISTSQTTALIHEKNAKAICYISAGTWEKWRPDAKQFPARLLGKSNHWPKEKWLDIRQVDILLPIMEARIAMCKNKGFDAIEFDNVDGFDNITGFPLSAADQAYYNSRLANIAHQAGLLVGLKNDLKQIQLLLPYFDFAINEQCFQYNECNALAPFIQVNKAVLNVEYKLKPKQFCQEAKTMHFSSIKKTLELTEEVRFCH